MTVLSCQTSIYAFSKNNEPVKRVASGTTLQIETYDCFQNQIQSVDTEFNAVDWNRINPATGPIYVEGAMPGDVLKSGRRDNPINFLRSAQSALCVWKIAGDSTGPTIV
jgi:acetamidase/formamidase